MHEWCRILLRGNGGRKKKNIVSFPETSSRRRSIFMRWRKMHFIFREHILFYFGDFQVFFFLASGSVWMSNRQSNGFILTQLNLFFFLLPRKYKKKKKKNNWQKMIKSSYPITLASPYSWIYVYIMKMYHCRAWQHLATETNGIYISSGWLPGVGSYSLSQFPSWSNGRPWPRASLSAH